MAAEPCVMCCGAIFWSGIRFVVFGCSHDTLAAHAGNALLRSAFDILQPEGVHLEGPLTDQIGDKLHAEYWARHTHSQ